MSLKMLTPNPGMPIPLDDADLGGPPEYALTFPVPGPDDYGEYIFLTLTPNGRHVAVLVDVVSTSDDRTVSGKLGDHVVVRVPKEAPWMLLKRELLRFITKAEASQKLAQAYQGMFPFPGGAGGSCPVHGEPQSVEAEKESGGYL